VRIDGQSVGQFDVPVRRDREAPAPLVAQLAEFAGCEALVELVWEGADQRALSEWRALALAGPEEERLAAADARAPRK
jgi:hypothetical protein